MATVNNINLVKNLEQKEIVNAGQTLITLTDVTLDLSSENVPTVYIEGSFERDFTVESSTTVRLGQTYPVGTKVYVLQYQLDQQT